MKKAELAARKKAEKEQEKLKQAKHWKDKKIDKAIKAADQKLQNAKIKEASKHKQSTAKSNVVTATNDENTNVKDTSSTNNTSNDADDA